MMYGVADDFGLWNDDWNEIRDGVLILKDNKACLDHMVTLENAGCLESDISKLNV